MRTRVFDWYDSKNDKVVYSFQTMHNGQWCNVAKDGKPLFFETEAERNQARKDFNKKPKKMNITDEKIKEVLDALDAYCVEYDEYECGLPGTTAAWNEMIKIVREILSK